MKSMRKYWIELFRAQILIAILIQQRVHHLLSDDDDDEQDVEEDDDEDDKDDEKEHMEVYLNHMWVDWVSNDPIGHVTELLSAIYQ